MKDTEWILVWNVCRALSLYQALLSKEFSWIILGNYHIPLRLHFAERERRWCLQMNCVGEFGWSRRKPQVEKACWKVRTQSHGKGVPPSVFKEGNMVEADFLVEMWKNQKKEGRKRHSEDFLNPSKDFCSFHSAPNADKTEKLPGMTHF